MTFQRDRGTKRNKRGAEKRTKNGQVGAATSRLLVQSGHVSISRRCRSSVSLRGVRYTQRNASWNERTNATVPYLYRAGNVNRVAQQNAVSQQRRARSCCTAMGTLEALNVPCLEHVTLYPASRCFNLVAISWPRLAVIAPRSHFPIRPMNS